MKKGLSADWILRFIKGMLIGSGFILPGVSGGALAAVFGIYERMISFIAHITKDFRRNVIFFLPVGLGGVFGVFLLSFVVSFLLGRYETQILWFFIGCILGTVPALWKQAAKQGRNAGHLAVMLVTAAAGYGFLRYGEQFLSASIPSHFGTWILAGGLIGLGAIVPGLSPSNFLVYLDLYKPLTDGIKSLDWGVILPVGIGGAACVLGLSRVMNYIFNRAYAGLFHFILGIVFASTVMIVPHGGDYSGTGAVASAVLGAAGILLGYWMSALEDQYKPD